MSIVWVAYCGECDGQLSDMEARNIETGSDTCGFCKENSDD